MVQLARPHRVLERPEDTSFCIPLCPWHQEQALMYSLHKYLSKSEYATVYLFERVIAYLKLIA